LRVILSSGKQQLSTAELDGCTDAAFVALFKASSDMSFVASDTRLPVNVSIICYSRAWQSRKEGQDEGDDLLSAQRGWSRIAAGLWHTKIELHWQSPVKTKDTHSSGCCRPATQLCRKVFSPYMVSHCV